MKTFVTSDLHFSHGNILKFCAETRQYDNVDHMNKEMINEWNFTVSTGDLTYIIGDVAFCNAEKAVQILRSLNGRKILVSGNHDVKLLKDKKFRECFDEIHNYHEIIWAGTLVCMFHYPIYDHNQASRGSIMLHGHRHGNPHNIPGRIMDVGMDATGKVVVSLDDIVQKMQSVQHMGHH